ncbi:nucleoid-associated protein [Achromobacter mucicolens]|uniref:Nucleoid-associated protein n=1 Tax=Achromobacter mucicolens TaxID=1389922 RepID=A0ABD4YZC9_9BURK|nr:nucleoid-associated protein [Achromobacter mucicolens]MDH1180883.1 nucleoid-associated protein [Achromobacter mucicolens]
METVDHVIVHKLVKEKHGKATIVERTAGLAVTDPVRKLIVAIHQLYASKASKGYGRFEADEVNYPSSTILRNTFINKNTSFVDGSRSLMTVLSSKAGTVPLATGGYVLMAQVTNAAHISWFLAAIINNVDGSVIDDKTLEVVDAMHVDLSNLRVAGRVNLTDWERADKDVRYIGFLKQRGEVADYFKAFLGCNELIADTEETKKLVGVLKNFAKGQGLDQTAEQEFLRSAFAYCQERNKNDEPLSLEALSNAAWPDEPKKLQDAFVANDVQISDGFVPDGRSLKALVRLRYKTDYWTVDIDRLALSQGYAHYNQAKGELTLMKLPDALKADLDREIADGG